MPSIKNGYVEGGSGWPASQSYNTKLYFKCDVGYVLNGTESVTCKENKTGLFSSTQIGIYDKEIPTCFGMYE